MYICIYLYVCVCICTYIYIDVTLDSCRKLARHGLPALCSIDGAASCTSSEQMLAPFM